MRIQVLKVLDQMGKDYLNSRTQLKFLLAPILVKNEEQQEQFYNLFDKYLRETEEALSQTPPPKPWHERIPSWLYFLIFSFLIGLIVWTLYNSLPGPVPVLGISHEPSVSIGDTAHFYHQCKDLPPGHQLVWELLDEEGNSEHQDTLKDHWHLPVERAGSTPNKTVRLSLLNHPQVEVFESKLIINCASKFLLDSLVNKKEWPDSTRINEPVTFNLNIEGTQNYQYKWFINDEEQNNSLDSFLHVFNDQGFYTVKAIINLPGEDGFCQKTFEESIVAFQKEEIAPLTEKTLLKEPNHSRAYFKMKWWMFLMLLGLIPLWLWYRWWKYRPGATAQKFDDTLRQIFDAPDRPPYFIPFRSMAHLIKADKTLFEFANTLRQRQEGLRKELNVEKSLNATIEKGGFPDIKLDRSTQPSEYLFLIDEQHRDSIQSRLFEYLVDFLKDKDVYAERYFYNREPFSLWKKKETEALSLQQLQRNHPYFRLVVMGDAHRWLRESGTDAKSLKKEYTDWLSRWSKLTLLTPVPPLSWTYKESGLGRWFPVFPSDMEGINAAFDDLQENREEEDKTIAFSRWQQNQAELRNADIDINYRQWRQITELEDYLKTYPKLWKWLCALTVHPAISWELTLAIGHALDVEVSFDQLLILSRIPWLQKGGFPPKLRLQLLDHLDAETERIARQTVKEELQAVEQLSKNSFVNFELQAGLAVQNFLLSPDNPEYQKAIKAFTQGDKPAVGKYRFKELDQQIRKYQKAKGKKGEGLNAFFADAEAGEQKRKDETPNPFTLRALLFSLAWMCVILSCLWLNGNDILYQLAFGERLSPVGLTNYEAKENLIAKEVFSPLDEAARLNNEAVDLYNEVGYSRQVSNLLNYAINSRGFYPIAMSNIEKGTYNRGIEFYKSYFETFDTTLLQEAKNWFTEPVTMGFGSFPVDKSHANGLIAWYLKDTIEAERMYDFIIDLDSSYFDTLQSIPNLRTLLNQTSVSVISNIEREVVYGTITGSEVNIRDLPNTLNSTILEKAIEGDRVEIFTHRTIEAPGNVMICAKTTSFYTIKDGEVILEGEMKKGKAVRFIEDSKKYEGYYKVELELDESNMVEGYINESDLIQLEAKDWFKIRHLKTNTLGWIISDYIRLDNEQVKDTLDREAPIIRDIVPQSESVIFKILEITANENDKSIDLEVTARDENGRPVPFFNETESLRKLELSMSNPNGGFSMLTTDKIEEIPGYLEKNNLLSKPRKVLFLIDMSGSMKTGEDKLANAKTAIREIMFSGILNGMKVEYATFSNTIRESRSLRKDNFDDEVGRINISRDQIRYLHTDLYRAIKVKTDELKSFAGDKVLILLTDGKDEQNRVPIYRELNPPQKISRNEIISHVGSLDSTFQIFPVGIGVGAQEDFLKSIADATINESDYYQYGVAPKDLGKSFFNVVGSLQPNILIKFIPDENNAIFANEVRGFTLNYYPDPTNKDFFYQAKKSVVFGTTLNKVDLRRIGAKEGNWSKVSTIIYGIIILSLLLVALISIVPLVSGFRFKKEYVRKYIDVKTPDGAYKDPLTLQKINDDDDVVILNNRKMMLLSSWKYLKSKKASMPDEMFSEFFSIYEEPDLLKRGKNLSLKRLWYGALGGFLAWLINWLISINSLILGDNLFRDFLSEIFDRTSYFSSIIYNQTCTGLALGVGVIFALSAQEKYENTKNLSITAFFLRVIYGGLIGGFFLFVQTIFTIEFIQYEFLGGIMSWVVLGIGIGVAWTLFSKFKIKDGIRGGFLAGFAAFIFYYLMGYTMKAISPDLAQMLSFMVFGAVFGVLTNINIVQSIGFELRQLSPIHLSGKIYQISKWLQSSNLDSIYIGNDPSCEIYIKWEDELAKKQNARLSRIDNIVYIEPVEGDILLNKKMIKKKAQLKNMDTIQLGLESVSTFLFVER